jgi:hypothetical protein
MERSRERTARSDWPDALTAFVLTSTLERAAVAWVTKGEGRLRRRATVLGVRADGPG